MIVTVPVVQPEPNPPCLNPSTVNAVLTAFWLFLVAYSIKNKWHMALCSLYVYIFHEFPKPLALAFGLTADLVKLTLGILFLADL